MNGADKTPTNTYVLIEDVAYPTDDLEQIEVAQKALQEAGLRQACIWVGDSECPASYPTMGRLKAEAPTTPTKLLDQKVLVETMPEHLRESHRAAGNWGQYPLNGADRLVVTLGEAIAMIESDEDYYTHIIDRVKALKAFDG